MDPIILNNTPLATYLQGTGEAEKGWEQAEQRKRPDPSPVRPSFAPSGSFRFGGQRHPSQNLEELSSRNFVQQLHDTCSSAFNSQIGRTENNQFLEQFRYVLIASQLLNEQPSHISYERHNLPEHAAATPRFTSDEIQSSNIYGLIVTGLAAFAFAWSLDWLRGHRKASVSPWKLSLVILLVLSGLVLFYQYFRRQRLHNLRGRALEIANAYVSVSKGFDSVISSTIALVQEVELISRGYRLSNPLPPITRLENNSQKPRCTRLRHSIIGAIDSLSKPYIEAHQALKEHAITDELEKYYDLYEISQADLQDVQAQKCSLEREEEGEEGGSLKFIKSRMLKLYLTRKLFLCSLLALDATGGHCDFKVWPAATEYLRHFSHLTAKCSLELERRLADEHEFPVPSSPKTVTSPAQDRLRAQMRKLGSLSSGIRSLQAKMQLIREETERTVNDSEDVTNLGGHLLTHYDSLGEDLKVLMREWEEGRASLASNIDRTEHRLSMSPRHSLAPMSPTLSLGGLTAVSGSPREPLKMMDVNAVHSRSLSTTDVSDSSDEVFEAIAAPRQRSILSREERIAKMQEDRVRREAVAEKAQRSTHMLKELETVIKLRPRGRTTGRNTLIKIVNMLEARLEQANLLKKVVDAIKDLVQDCNFDCNDSGIALQAMDNSHVALVSMMLKAESFSPFRCDRNIALGINLSSLMKVLRCAQNEDILTLKADDHPDSVNLVFESSESDRLSEYDIKLMDIDQEHLGIPETEYAATISMPSPEFSKICRDLMALSESVSIEATKEGCKFSCTGDIGNGAVTLRSHSNVEKPELNVDINLSEPVALTFSLKYLVNFCKAAGLSSTVKLCLSNEVPLLVEYALASNSYLRFYLAPKIGDEE